MEETRLRTTFGISPKSHVIHTSLYVGRVKNINDNFPQHNMTRGRIKKVIKHK